jgi:hypothetical protein
MVVLSIPERPRIAAHDLAVFVLTASHRFD